jgi:hypothetical protein
VSLLGPNISDAEKRRTTRVARRVPIAVTGTDVLNQPFRIVTQTLSVSCHGCKYKSKHYIPKHSVVSIEICSVGLPVRVVSGRVVWVQRPRALNQEFEIGLEFNIPQNAWGIAPPPEDWLPFCKEATATSLAPDQKTPSIAKVPAGAAASREAPLSARSIEQGDTIVYDLANLQLVARDTQLCETIERAIAKSIERISGSLIKGIVQELPSTLGPAIVEKVYQEITDKFEIRPKRSHAKRRGLNESKVPRTFGKEDTRQHVPEGTYENGHQGK